MMRGRNFHGQIAVRYRPMLAKSEWPIGKFHDIKMQRDLVERRRALS